jgi:hypothetical protein
MNDNEQKMTATVKVTALTLLSAVTFFLLACSAGASGAAQNDAKRQAETGRGEKSQRPKGEKNAKKVAEEFVEEPKESAEGAPRATRSVVINAVRLSDQAVHALEQAYRTRIQDGNYWYDRRTGAWGGEGGPTVGFVLAGLNIGGHLRADASKGDTGVFVNGRELHRLDVLGLMQITPVYRGRYWVDAQGNGGYEGGPAFFNLVQLARAAASRRGGAGGGPWSYNSKYFGSVGGDGQGFLFYSGKDAAGNSYSYFPGN